MKALNLTQHPATPEQAAAGVQDVASQDVASLKGLLNFEEIPTPADMQDRAATLVEVCRCYGVSAAMIGGAPFFMPILEKELVKAGISPLYAFSKRESVDAVQADGSTLKTSVFKHVGFVEGGHYE